jgi:hypothetical protein
MVKEKKEKETSAASESQTNTDNTMKSANSSTKPVDQTSSSNSQPSVSTTSVSISANQSAYMLNLYNAFYNQYMQNYAQQKLPESTNDTSEYDTLTQQATFYAKQQQSIQKQLETCLSSATQQYIKDLIP